MLAQRQSDTAPELAIRRALHAMGLRYRLHQKIVPGTRRSVDIVFARARVAVLIDGCYWHGCECKPGTKANGDWWAAKIAGNRARDADTDDRLRAAGWRVIRVPEHEVPEAAALRVAAVVTASRVAE